MREIILVNRHNHPLFRSTIRVFNFFFTCNDGQCALFQYVYLSLYDFGTKFLFAFQINVTILLIHIFDYGLYIRIVDIQFLDVVFVHYWKWCVVFVVGLLCVFDVQLNNFNKIISKLIEFVVAEGWMDQMGNFWASHFRQSQPSICCLIKFTRT